MRVGRTAAVHIFREEWFAEDVDGRYLIDGDGRWYEVSYCPYAHATTMRRVQIEHTDMHEKAVAAIQADAEKRRKAR